MEYILCRTGDPAIALNAFGVALYYTLSYQPSKKKTKMSGYVFVVKEQPNPENKYPLPGY